MKHVYQLKAYFECPFTGTGGRQDRVVWSTTVFATWKAADSRVEKFKAVIRKSQVAGDDYPVLVKIVPLEIIYE